jgi:hypothetical protein
VVKLLVLAQKSWVRLPPWWILICIFYFFSWFHSCCLLLHLSLQLFIFFLVSKVLYLFLQPFSLIGQIDEMYKFIYMFFTIIVTLLIQRTTTNSNLSQNMGRFIPVKSMMFHTSNPWWYQGLSQNLGPNWWLYGPFSNPWWNLKNHNRCYLSCDVFNKRHLKSITD